MEARQVAVSFVELWSAGRLDEAYALFADDGIWEIPGDLPFSGEHDKQTMYAHNRNLVGFYAQWPQWIIDGVIAEGDKVAIEARSIADTPGGLKYRNHYHLWFSVKDGKITRLKEYMDTKHVADFKTAMKFSADAATAQRKDSYEDKLNY